MIKGAPYQFFGSDTIYNGPIVEDHLQMALEMYVKMEYK